MTSEKHSGPPHPGSQIHPAEKPPATPPPPPVPPPLPDKHAGPPHSASTAYAAEKPPATPPPLRVPPPLPDEHAGPPHSASKVHAAEKAPATPPPVPVPLPISDKQSGAVHSTSKVHAVNKAPATPSIPAPPPIRKYVQSKFAWGYLGENLFRNGFGGWLMVFGYVFSAFMGLLSSWEPGFTSYGSSTATRYDPGRVDFSHFNTSALSEGTIFSVGAGTWLITVAVLVGALFLCARRRDLQSLAYRAGPIACAFFLIWWAKHYADNIPDMLSANSSGDQHQPPGPMFFALGQFLVGIGGGLVWWRNARSDASTAPPK